MVDCAICGEKDIPEEKCHWCGKFICHTCTSGSKYAAGAGKVNICRLCFKNGFNQAEFQRMR